MDHLNAIRMANRVRDASDAHHVVMRAIGVVSLSCPLLVACASTGPELYPDGLHRPELLGLSPRAVRLVVRERRSPPPDDTEKIVVRVREVLAETLSRAGVEVREDSQNELSVSIARPGRPVEGFSPDACTELIGRLEQRGGVFVQVSSTRCFEWRHFLGFSLGTDPNKMLQSSMNELLEQLDAQFARLPLPIREEAGPAPRVAR